MTFIRIVKALGAASLFVLRRIGRMGLFKEIIETSEEFGVWS